MNKQNGNMGIVANTGHCNDGSGVQKHSAGELYPFGVYAQESHTGLMWGIFGPTVKEGFRIIGNYEQANASATVQKRIYERNQQKRNAKMREITLPVITANNAVADAIVPTTRKRATDTIRKGCEGFAIGHANPTYPWVIFRHDSNVGLRTGAYHPDGREIRGYVSDEAVTEAIAQLQA